jgi:hypothetical protein
MLIDTNSERRAAAQLLYGSIKKLAVLHHKILIRVVSPKKYFFVSEPLEGSSLTLDFLWELFEPKKA